MTDYVKRDIVKTLKAALNDMPVVVLTGMRQVGKSTLLRMQPEIRDREYISLDDFAILETARRNPESLLAGDEPVSIDEAQKCPELLDAIKVNVDKHRVPGRFLLSGSANFSLLEGISESLAGRAVYFNLHPMTRREISGGTGKQPFILKFFKDLKLSNGEYKPVTTGDVLTGGMPSVCLGDITNPWLWFKGYEQTYLERDLRELSQVADLVQFRRLMNLAALRTGGLLQVSGIARDAGLSVSTASRYLDLLETSFVINRLGAFLANKSSRIIKSPKLYVSDSGLACYLAGFTDSADPVSELLWGAMVETYAAQNLAGIINSRWPTARLSFWNVQGRHEVDFVVESGRTSIGIEVKWASRWRGKDLDGLKAFIRTTPGCKAAILAYNGPRAVQLGDRLYAIPMSLLFS